MHNEFTAIVERDQEWYVSFCAEVPGANGQGRTREECLTSLAEAIALIVGEQAVAVAGSPSRSERQL